MKILTNEVNKKGKYVSEESRSNGCEYFINGGVGWKCAVDDGEMSLQSLRDVVPTPSRMNHGCHHLNVHDVRELSWLFKVVEASHFHQLTSYFIRHLKYSPSYPTY